MSEAMLLYRARSASVAGGAHVVIAERTHGHRTSIMRSLRKAVARATGKGKNLRGAGGIPSPRAGRSTAAVALAVAALLRAATPRVRAARGPGVDDGRRVAGIARI